MPFINELLEVLNKNFKTRCNALNGCYISSDCVFKYTFI